MKSALSQLISEVEGLIQAAQLKAARRSLLAVKRLDTPRSDRLKLAQLCRRAGLVSLALRVLNPVVRPSAKQPVRPTPEELAEYAGLLIRSGANSEALGILKTLDAARTPEALLYQAYARITQWDYERCIPFLVRYLGVADLAPMQKVIGRLNLAASYVHERRSAEAQPHLEELLETTARERLPQFHGNALELCAQNAIFQGRWKEADAFLDRAERHLNEVGGLDHLFVRKWKAIARALGSPGDTTAAAALQDVRREAAAVGHWETVRDCDLYLGTAARDTERLARVYFGTPFESFRARIRVETGEHWRVPESWEWKEGAVKRTLDLASGCWQDETVALKPGQILHRLLWTLASDRYRPFRAPALFDTLFPGEYFNPFSSPDRIHEAVRRLREWCAKERAAVSVEERKGHYSLALSGATALRYASESADPVEAPWVRMKRHFGDRFFSTKEAARELGLSDRTASRLIGEAKASGRLLASGRSQFVRYRFR